MKKALYIIFGMWLVVVVSPCFGMWNVKTVGMTQGLDTWTIAARLGAISDETVATPIFNSDAVSFVITITNAGNYQLVENINYPIVIQASHVVLDLNSYTVTHTIANSNVITVTTALSEVAVYNGYVQNTGGTGTGSGIYVSSGCSKVSLYDMTIFGCHCGVRLAGLTGINNDVRSSDALNLRCISNDIGMLLEYASASTIKNCNALYSMQSGFELFSSQSNCFYDCNSLKTTGTATAAGFKSTGGTSNMFYRCMAQQTKTSSLAFGDTANGFLLTGTELKTKIVKSVVTETDVVSSPTAVTNGINVCPLLLSGTDLFSTATQLVGIGSFAEPTAVAWSPDTSYCALSTTYTCLVYKFNTATNDFVRVASVVNSTGSFRTTLDWSPDGKYLAAGMSFPSDGLGRLRIYTFNGSSLALSAYSTVPTFAVSCLAWSPNGKYIACVDPNNPSYIRMFSFDGSTLTNISNSASLTNPSSQDMQLAWSPDSSALAVVTIAQTTVYVYPVLQGGILGSPVTQSIAGQHGYSVRWSPNGHYFAVGDESFLRVFLWDGTSMTAGPIIVGPGINVIEALSWSPCGNYIVVGDYLNNIFLYQFTGAALNLVAIPSTVLNSSTMTLSWSSDGRFIVAGSLTGMVRILRVMYGPSDCLVDNCRVSDTAASNLNMGRGFVAGGSNLFVNNASSNNTMSYSYGIPNVYDGRFEISRNVVQPFDNITLPSTL